MTTLRVATLNCRNTADRWRQRAPLLLDQLAELDASIVALQEMRHFPDQSRWIAERLGARTGRAHWRHAAWKTGLRWLQEGSAILSRLPILERSRLCLEGQNRVVGFVRVALPGSAVLDVYNVHLATRSEQVRTAQAERIIEWIGSRSGVPALVAGDFNARPDQPTMDVFRRFLRSAHVVVHGAEPARTVPTPLRRRWARPAVLDYILVNDLVDVQDARVAFDAVAPRDPHLSASDHYGLVATIGVAAGR